VTGRGLTSPWLGRLVDQHEQAPVLIGWATASAIEAAEFAIVGEQPFAAAEGDRISAASSPRFGRDLIWVSPLE